MVNYIDYGKQIYDMDNPREVRRMAVFVARAILHTSKLNQLIDFFHQDAVLTAFIEDTPFPIEQATRSFFYKGSTFDERWQLIHTHFGFLHEMVKDEFFMQICCYQPPERYFLWKTMLDDQPLTAELSICAGQRKEGCLSVLMRYAGHDLYQIMFWLNYDKNHEMCLWIGAMQGPNMEGAKDVVKKVTKFCHGYRTKNLIFYIVQAVARTMGVKAIYAVTNEGYYANNHVRVDRKLKTSFSDFWQEVGGESTNDSRFDKLPLIEQRKTMEEVPTRKRAVYRKRFILLDEIDVIVSANVARILK